MSITDTKATTQTLLTAPSTNHKADLYAHYWRRVKILYAIHLITTVTFVCVFARFHWHIDQLHLRAELGDGDVVTLPPERARREDEWRVQAAHTIVEVRGWATRAHVRVQKETITSVCNQVHEFCADKDSKLRGYPGAKRNCDYVCEYDVQAPLVHKAKTARTDEPAKWAQWVHRVRQACQVMSAKSDQLAVPADVIAHCPTCSCIE